MKVLFATTNPAKVKKYKDYLKKEEYKLYLKKIEILESEARIRINEKRKEIHRIHCKTGRGSVGD